LEVGDGVSVKNLVGSPELVVWAMVQILLQALLCDTVIVLLASVRSIGLMYWVTCLMFCVAGRRIISLFMCCAPFQVAIFKKKNIVIKFKYDLNTIKSEICQSAWNEGPILSFEACSFNTVDHASNLPSRLDKMLVY
jgi:hypothetical protein